MVKFNKDKFLKSELGEEWTEIIKAINFYMEKGSRLETEKLIAEHQGIRKAVKHFYGVDYRFDRTFDRFGLVSDDGDWLYKERIARGRYECNEEEKTKVLRKMEIEAERFETGDQIEVIFANNERHLATAVQQQDDGMLFVLDDCLDEAYHMNDRNTNEGGYEASDMREHLQKIAAALPEDFKSRLVPFENGDHLRLLTKEEVFGNGPERDGQIPYFKNTKNRIALRKEEHERYWLRDVAGSTIFASVFSSGLADCDPASNSLGVRPAFCICYP